MPTLDILYDKTTKLQNDYYTYDEIELGHVLGSTIIEVHENLPSPEDFYNFISKMFELSKNKYHLLLDELDYIDKNYNINDEKYNNLKYNILLASLYQFLIITPEPLELTYFF